MPRRPRLVATGVPLHIVQRGNNRQTCFRDNSDYFVYRDLLQRAARGAKCDVHSYALMPNHVHILATPQESDSAAVMMKAAGERYVRYFNERNKRTGTLWDGRFKSCLVHDEAYLMVCYRYIELNPVRAGIVQDPGLYPWSSYRCNAEGARDDLVTPHPIFQAIGLCDEEIYQRYRDLIREALPEDQLAILRDATNHNYACGTDRFLESMKESLGRQVRRQVEYRSAASPTTAVENAQVWSDPGV